MSSDARTAQEQLTPEERRSMLRAFADRMLLKITSMDDPEDMPGADRAVRMAASIERIYSSCDRAEKHAPDPQKIEAERARNAKEAIHARYDLASTISLGKKNREKLGDAWDAAGELIKCRVPTPRALTPGVLAPAPAPAQSPAKPQTPVPVTAAAAPLPGLPGFPQPHPSMTVFELADGLAQFEKAVASVLGRRADTAAPP